MKVIDYIHIKNTFGHKDSKIEFKEGRNYLVGKIGSGKSVVLECIAFAYFGSVALRDTSSAYKDIYVELQFNYQNNVFKLIRKINDASLSIFDESSNSFSEIANSTSVVNQKIVNLFGYNYDIFLLSNFCKQKKLSHFSEMTPAKRLQYIDKISGLEESKELLTWLNSKRKNLKERIVDFEKIVVTPTLPKDVDLDFDYDSNIELLNDRLQQLYQLYIEINNVIIPHVQKPSLNLSVLESNLSKIQKEDLTLIFDNLKSINTLEVQIDSVINEVNKLPRLSVNQRLYSLEEASTLLEQDKYKNILESDVNLTCPSCHHEGLANIFVTAPISPSQGVSYLDLVTIVKYHSEGYDAIREQLSRDLDSLESHKNIILKSLPDFVIPLSIQSLTDSVEYLDVKLKSHDEAVLKYQEDLELFQKQTQLKTDLEEQAENLVSTQNEDIKLKDDFKRLSYLKIQYIQQLELYNQVSNKLAELYVEFELIVNLIKDVVELSSNIKNQTIPLINYHASKNLKLISKGSMSKIEITPNYDLIIDGSRVGVKSGGQQDLASLAFRLSLSKSIVTGMLPLFLADEVDSAGGEGDSDDIIEAINEISYNGFQIIMSTHKNINNLENINIIRL